MKHEFLKNDTLNFQFDFKRQIFNLSQAMFFKNWHSAMQILEDLIPLAISQDYRLMKSIPTSLINQQIFREFKHAKRVSLYGKWLAEACLFQNPEDIECCGFVHDIGKLMIEPSILYKEEQLNQDEWDSIMKHPQLGAYLLSFSNQYNSFMPIVKQHHERWDGNGYPMGLKEREILFPARILAIVDAYDAMTCNRGYRDRIISNLASDEIKRCAGTQFDPEIAFLFTDHVLEMKDCSLFRDTLFKVD